MPTEHENDAENYPNFDELSANVALVLCLWHEQQLHLAVARQVVKGACWWVSNALGKHDNCPHWSKAAAAKRATSNSWSTDHQLVHEHVIPRKYIEGKILSLETPSAENVKALLELSCVHRHQRRARIVWSIQNPPRNAERLACRRRPMGSLWKRWYRAPRHNSLSRSLTAQPTV